MHLFHDIAPTYKLPSNVNLRKRGPVRKVFNGLSQHFITKYINIFVLFKSISWKNCDYILTEAALWHLPCPFHKQHHIVIVNPLLDLGLALFRICKRLFRLRLEGTHASYESRPNWRVCNFKEHHFLIISHKINKKWDCAYSKSKDNPYLLFSQETLDLRQCSTLHKIFTVSNKIWLCRNPWRWSEGDPSRDQKSFPGSRKKIPSRRQQVARRCKIFFWNQWSIWNTLWWTEEEYIWCYRHVF